jgi:hypothetical protein
VVSYALGWSGLVDRGQSESLCPEGTIGLSLGFQPQVRIQKGRSPEGAKDKQLGDTRRRASSIRRLKSLYLPPFQGGKHILSVPGVKTPG